MLCEWHWVFTDSVTSLSIQCVVPFGTQCGMVFCGMAVPKLLSCDLLLCVLAYCDFCIANSDCSAVLV